MNQADESPLAPLLADRDVVVLDGGLATELERRGHSLTDELWSARLLLDAPEAVRGVHAEFVAAGADVIVSSSYQATVAGFQRARELTDEQAVHALQRSVQLAREAAVDRPVLVAAGVGPYGAAQADGSEYRGDDGLTVEQLADWHRRRFHLLADSGADLLACETIPSLREAEAVLRLLEESPGVWAWISFSCRDSRSVSDGTPLAECVAAVAEHSRAAAVGVNCVPPRLVAQLLQKAAAVTSLPLLCYPNSGEHWDADRRQWVGGRDPSLLADLAPEWRGAGARLIGGCCRTSPDEIARLARSVAEPM